jgi:cyclophilin family peptidyl-prolyl cis-trans isomerase
MKKAAFLTLTYVFLFNCSMMGQDKKAPSTEPKIGREVVVLLKTTMGNIKLKLYNETPLHRDNFVKLVESGYYDGLLFHRVINNFMIQSGDPLSRNAPAGRMLGTGGPNYTIPAEILPQIKHKRGSLAAARDNNPQKASSGSQFYIVHNKNGTPHLDGQYTVFGETIEGFDVIDKIATVKTIAADRPEEDVKIIKATIISQIKTTTISQATSDETPEVIAEKGKIQIQKIDNNNYSFFSTQLYLGVYNKYREIPNGYIATSGNEETFISFDGQKSRPYYTIGEFINGYALVGHKSSLYGLIDNTGNEVVYSIYNADVKRPEFIILDKGNQSFYFKNGKQIFPEYEIVGGSDRSDFFNNGNLIARKNGKYGIIDTLGNVVTPFNYALIKRLPTINSQDKEKFNLSLLPAKTEDGKWGYINRKTGNVDIPCNYIVDDADFWAIANVYFNGINVSAGNALVKQKGDVYAMNRQGAKVGLSVAEQKEKDRQEAIARAEAKRINDIKNAQIGEKLLYSETWTYREGFWIFQTSGSYSMKVTCFIERIEGNRYQLRVGDVESSSSEKYSTPTINGVRVSKGNIIWAKPLEDTKWVYGE